MTSFFASVFLTLIAGGAFGVALRRLGLGGALAVALYAGSFVLTWEMFLFDRAGLPWVVALLVLPGVVAALGTWWLAGRPAPRGSSFRASPWVGAPAAITAAALAVWLPYERALPLSSRNWDAWAIWLFKARAFWIDGGIGSLLERSGEFSSQPGYPLLAPLQAAFEYLIAGGVDGQLSKLWSPVWYVAGVVLFGAIARRMAPAWLAYTATALLAAGNMQHVMAFEYAGYADTVLSFYFVAAGGFLYLWHVDESRLWMVAAVVAATAAAWTKNEGQFFLAGVGVLVAAQLARSKAPWIEWVLAAAVPVVVMGSWLATLRTYGVEAAGFVPGIDFSAELFRIAAVDLAGKAFDLGRFPLTFPLFVVACAVAAATRLRFSCWVMPTLTAWHVTGVLLAYATGRNEINWWLETSAFRLLGQIAPLAVLAIVPIAAEWCGVSADDVSGNLASGDGQNVEGGAAALAAPARARGRKRSGGGARRVRKDRG